MSTNHFSGVLSQVQQAPANQRAGKLIEAIAQQMQQSTNPQTKQWGDDLESIKPQLTQACNSQQQS